MKTILEKINNWNNLSSSEKIRIGDFFITHESNILAWDKSFSDLSPSKQKKVLTLNTY
jgi:hypothetical protein